METVKGVLEKFGTGKENLIQIMLELQQLSGNNYLPQEWVEEVAKALEMPMSKVYGVMTFYAMFDTEKRGKNLIEVCKSGPCHVAGAENVMELLEEALRIKPGETTDDGLFTLEYSACFGACDIAPAIKIGENVYGNLTEAKLKEIINSYKEGLN
ncbi:NADH dehydrogenase (quinone) [Syntrophobotulus glycolicus DSM 8271]|uniref:NADH dehydrogenase (Quinone) n=1 Tax=Syntrophobotulus glycolicus (strain DSM 8271 / FlGlyR) TaxID=645991 RepID=F0SZ67_SYNGF|nr:NAD(P)H-dependent oxidoreductase subunit E [Syntrophobotulus glycolicus]ADY57185.1 NADH dehydrogenase (quinone) [Syntrophobotulus glycolicus DSM 8271]